MSIGFARPRRLRFASGGDVVAQSLASELSLRICNRTTIIAAPTTATLSHPISKAPTKTPMSTPTAPQNCFTGSG